MHHFAIARKRQFFKWASKLLRLSPCGDSNEQGLREKFFQGVRRSTPGLQNLVKLLKINQKRSSLKFGPIFCPRLGEEQKEEKKIGPKLDATTSTLLGPP